MTENLHTGVLHSISRYAYYLKQGPFGSMTGVQRMNSSSTFKSTLLSQGERNARTDLVISYIMPSCVSLVRVLASSLPYVPQQPCGEEKTKNVSPNHLKD